MDEELFTKLVNAVGWPAAAIFGMLWVIYKLGSRALNAHIKFLRFLKVKINQMVESQKTIPETIKHVCRYPEEKPPCEDTSRP